MMINFTAWCYRLVLFPLAFIMTHLLWWAAPHKLRSSLSLKWQKTKLSPKQTPTIMIHAASGEIEYAKPLIRQLQEQYPDKNILVTYSSPSIHRLLNPDNTFQLSPLPFDFYCLMKKFLIRNQIERVYIARSDVWLNLTWACQNLNIPCVLFAATQTQPISYLKAQQLQFLQHIFTVNEEDQKNLQSKITSPVSTIGDPRFDQVFYRLQNPKTLPKKLLICENPSKVFIAGSLWPQDFEVLGPLLPTLIQNNYQIILAPHEVDLSTLSWYQNELNKLNLAVIRYQDYLKLQPFQILLIDQIGYLAELYSLAHITFVGGSFKAKVHSVMEPLATGNLVLVGPYHTNNREAITFKQFILPGAPALNPVTVIKNTLEAKHFFDIIDHIDLTQSKEQVRTLCLKHQGATQTLLQLTRH